jgi:MoaD family protein
MLLTVEIRFYSVLREVVGRETLMLRLRQDATIETMLDRLFTVYGDRLRKKLLKETNWVIMLNDRNIQFLKNRETPLSDGDRIRILSPLSGG